MRILTVEWSSRSTEVDGSSSPSAGTTAAPCAGTATPRFRVRTHNGGVIEDVDVSAAVAGREFSSELRQVLDEARILGLIGSADLDMTLAHAAGFTAGVAEAPETCADLGSGGGVPGLVLAELWPNTRVWLMDGSEKRAAFLSRGAELLGREDQVTVLPLRVEEAGRKEELRGGFEVVTARSFGPPAVTAECAAPLLQLRGWLIVSEPPAEEVSVRSAPERWPVGGLQELGMVPVKTWRSPFHFQAIEQQDRCPTRYPRRVGIPAKRPLF